jgi:hypothetical protein
MGEEENGGTAHGGMGNGRLAGGLSRGTGRRFDPKARRAAPF